MLYHKEYQALIVEPFCGLWDDNPVIPFMQELHNKGVQVIVTSTMTSEKLYEFFGIENGKDYDYYLEKPFSIRDNLCPLLNVIAERYVTNVITNSRSVIQIMSLT